jgi:rare lipoprotein A
MTAAHRTLPFGTRVRVTHAGNGRSVDVKINDRGPFTGGRIIDLSKAAAELIGMTAQGIAIRSVTVLVSDTPAVQLGR